MTSNFHPGERMVQDIAGVPDAWREMAEGFIRSELADQHETFFNALQMLFMALLDREGRPWAVPLFGDRGIAKVKSARTLLLTHAPCLANPFGLDTTPGAAVGLLGIDLATRQRVKFNGGFIDQTSTGLMVHVDQAFGNCPQYIQSREFDTSQGGRRPIVERADSGSTAIRQIIDNADTFFIASRGPGVADGSGPTLDASHRGGRPGFLRMDANGKLSFPDFRGNRFFNTLGNIEADGRVGLFVPDFATGAAALVTGRAAVDWQADRIGTFAGAERIVDVICDEVWHVADR